MTGVPTSVPTRPIPRLWLRRSAASCFLWWASLASAGGQADLLERLADDLVEVGILPQVDAGAHGVVERLDDRVAVRLGGGDDDAHRAPRLVHARRGSAASRSCRCSLSTARLMTDQVTSMSRTFSTSISQRDVIHAHGQIGSNHISTASRLVLGLSFASTMRPIMALPPCAPIAVVDRSGFRARMARDDAVHRRTVAPPRPFPGGPYVPGKNLTRDEAASRAGILRRRLLRRPPRPDHGSGRTSAPSPRCGSPAPSPGADTFIDLIADSVETVTLNGVDLDPADGLRRTRGSPCPAWPPRTS